MEKLLTANEVAGILHCHPQTVYRNKELPCVSIPGIGIRFKEKDINKYIEQRTINPPQIINNQSFSLQNPPDYDILLSEKLGGKSELAKSKSKTRYNFGYGAIYQRKIKNGKIRWYLDYYDADHCRVQKVAAHAITREEAILALKEEVAKTFNKEYGIKKQKARIRFKEFADMYLENYAKSNKKSWKDDAYRLQKFIAFFGNKCLHEVTAFDIEKFKATKIKEELSRSTINRYLTILKRVYNIAIDWGYIKENPVNRVKFYSEKENLKERIITEEEEDRLLEASSEHLRPILIVALNTGMRRGEILNLRWSQIDFQAKEIKILKTKSGKPRIVDINSLLLEEFMKMKSESKNSQYVFLNSKTGKPYKKLQTSFEGACRRSKIEGLRFHDLRHTFASRLIGKGVDLIRVKELLGHSTVKITERYTHSNREEKKKAVELLCQKSPKIAEILENLLHKCDTGKSKQQSKDVSSLFSVN